MQNVISSCGPRSLDDEEKVEVRCGLQIVGRVTRTVLIELPRSVAQRYGAGEV